MRVLLLNPPFLPMFSRESRSPAVTKSSTLYYPMWLAYATGVLEADGAEALLLDAPAEGLSREATVERAVRFSPDLAVVETSTPSIHSDADVAAELKTATGACVVMVGPHVSALPEESLELAPGVDAVARGEYDYTVRDLGRAVSEAAGPWRSLSEPQREEAMGSVLGLTWRVGERIETNASRPLIEDLDSVPWVSGVYDRHLRHVMRRYFYANSRHPVIVLVSGRGCPNHCCYCVYPQTMTGHRYRYRSVEDVVEEFASVVKGFPEVREVFLEDDTLTVDTERAVAFSEALQHRGLRVRWSTNSRADAAYEALSAMRRAGCRLLCVGYESGSQGVLNRMGKNLRVEQIHDFARDARRAGLLVHGCFLVGNPGETTQTLEVTLEMAKRLNPDTAQFYPVMAYPGTRLFSWAERHGYLTTRDWRQWLTPEGLHNCVVSRPGLTKEELVAWCDRARREFYLRPRYVLRKLLQVMAHPGEAGRMARAGRALLGYLWRGSGVRPDSSRAST